MVLWVLWLSYGTFYFTRYNFSVAVPGIVAELHYTKAQMGTVLMSLKLAYGVGQLINGQLAEQWRPRRLMAIGLLASVVLNVLFGCMTSLYFMTFIWACNGYVQALGWPATMRVAANWFPPSQRGRAIGIIGTGYQLCAALTMVVAGWAAENYGWRAAFYIPAILVSVSAIHLLIFLKDSPRQVPEAQVPAQLPPIHSHSTFENLKLTLANPALWIVAISLCLMDACRYGFSDWGVTHLKEVQHVGISSAAFKLAILPFGGICGALVSGWMSDKFFNGRRVPVICLFLASLGAAGLVYDRIIHFGVGASVLILFVVGFCMYGPHVLLVGTLPVDLAKKGTAAAAAGFVNFMGYMGAAAGDKVTGNLAEKKGWQFAVLFWAGCAIGAALIMTGLWTLEKKSAARPDVPEK